VDFTTRLDVGAYADAITLRLKGRWARREGRDSPARRIVRALTGPGYSVAAEPACGAPFRKSSTLGQSAAKWRDSTKASTFSRPKIVWRPSLGAWFILTSTTNYDYASSLGIQWGAGTDTPLLGDFDGDGRAELIIWRASTGQWFWLSSLSGYSYSAAGMKQWGSQAAGDIPMIR
jgi:hypothetical protein